MYYGPYTQILTTDHCEYELGVRSTFRHLRDRELDLEVMSSNPDQVELGVHNISVLSHTWTKNMAYTCSFYQLEP